MTEPTYLGPIEEEKKNEPKYLGEIVQKEIKTPWSAKHPYLAAIPPSLWELGTETIPFGKFLRGEVREQYKKAPKATTLPATEEQGVPSELAAKEEGITKEAMLGMEAEVLAHWIAFPGALKGVGGLAKEVLPSKIVSFATKERKLPWFKPKPKVEKPVDVEVAPAEQSELPTMNQKLKEKIGKEEIVEPEVTPKVEKPVFVGEIKLELPKPEEAGFISPPTAQEVKDLGNKFYQRFFDRTWSIESASRKAKKLGAEILPGEDPEFLSRTYLGNQARWVQMMENQTFRMRPNGKIEFTGEGFKPILRDYGNANPFKNIDVAEKDLGNYLVAKRYIADLQRPNIKGEIIAKPEQITWANNTLEDLNLRYGTLDLFDQTGQRLYDFQKRILNLLVDSGRISEEQFSNIIAKNPHYVPFERIFPEESVSVLTGGGLFKKTPQPVKKIKGSEREVSDVLESIMKQSYRILDIAERNKVSQSVALLEDTLPNAVKTIRTPMAKVATVEGEPVFRPSYFLKPNQVEYYIDGKRHILEVSSLMAEAMGGLNELSSGMLTKIFSIPAHMLRVGATITPEFMFRNPIRDQFTASINTMVRFKPFVNAPEAIAEILGKGEVYQKWLASGGAQSTLNEMNRSNLTKTVKELMGQRSLLKHFNVITKAQDLSQLFEMTTRVQAFRAGQRAGLSDIEAGFLAREATLDFARRGTELKNWNRMTAFFNAGIQGTDKAVRTFIENPAGATAKCLAEITIPSVLLFMANKDNPDYWEQPRWARRLFWLIPTGSKDVPFIRIPKPFLYGQVFGSLTEEFMGYALTENKDAFRDFETTMIDALSPASGDPTSLFLPTAIKPIIENEVNWSFFRQRPIVPEGKQKILPFQQYSRFTSETAKDIGKELGISPTKLENFSRGYLGGSGDYALQIADFMQHKKKEMETQDYPLVKGFTTRPAEAMSQSLADFYEDSDRVIQIYNGYKFALKTGNKKDLDQIFSKFPNLWIVGSQIENLREQLNRVNLMINQINESNLSEENKKDKIKSLEINKMEFARKGNEVIRKIKNNPYISKGQIP